MVKIMRINVIISCFVVASSVSVLFNPAKVQQETRNGVAKKRVHFLAY